MVASTWNKGWRRPWDGQGSKANKDTAPCTAALRQAGGKRVFWLHNVETIRIYQLELFSFMIHKMFA